MLLHALVLAPEDGAVARRLEALLARADVVATRVDRPEDLWAHLAGEGAELVLLGREPGPHTISRTVGDLRSLPEPPEVIVVGGAIGREERAEALAAGAIGILDERLPDEALRGVLEALLQRRRESLIGRLRDEGPDPFRLGEIVSRSDAMRRVVALARRVAAADTSLLILGETGSGKEWLARAIHAEGPRSAGPFVGVNCAAVPETLLESELFGHERGAFTGAHRTRRGQFELAHRGTLFLDEIAEMSPGLQAKLLRVLQDRRIQRLGGEEAIDVDVRVIAATNRNVEEAMRAREFRPDLYYRLGVVTIELPPLRTRAEDVPRLLELHLERFRRRLRRADLRGFTPAAAEALQAYSWPGNVRELINVVERAVLLAPGPRIDVGDLPEAVGGSAGELPPPRAAEAPDLSVPLPEAVRRLVDDYERRHLEALLRAEAGRLAAVAARAGIEPRTLYNKMTRLGLDKREYRPGRAPVSESPGVTRPRR